jgi:hypothetical protein
MIKEYTTVLLMKDFINQYCGRELVSGDGGTDLWRTAKGKIYTLKYLAI